MIVTAANARKLGMFSRAAAVRSGAMNGLGATKTIYMDPVHITGNASSELSWNDPYAVSPAQKLREEDAPEVPTTASMMAPAPLLAATNDVPVSAPSEWSNPFPSRAAPTLSFPSISTPVGIALGAAVVIGITWWVLRK